MAVLEEVRVAGEQEPAPVSRDTEFRDVLRPDRGEASDGVPAIADDRLEEKLVLAVAEQDPRMTLARFRAASTESR